MFEDPVKGAVVELAAQSVGGVPDQYKDVYVENIDDEKDLKNAIPNKMVIKVAHIDKDIIKNGGTIADASQSAESSGVHGGYVTPQDITAVVTAGRDDKETATEYGRYLWKQAALKKDESLNVCVLCVGLRPNHNVLFCLICVYYVCLYRRVTQ